MEALVAFLLLLIMLATGIPIAFCLFTAGFIGIYLLRGFDVALASIGNMPFSAVANHDLIVIPLFVLTGRIAASSGISRDAFEAAYRWLGRLRGGLAASTIATCAFFAGTCGSSAADASTVGLIAIPQMKRFKYDDVIATATVAAGGVIGIMIPPSAMLVVYGIITGASIGKLLLAGVVPGIMMAFVFITGIVILATLKPHLAPSGESFTWRERFAVLPKLWGIAALFSVIVGGIYGGFFTPGEAAAGGAFVAVAIAVSRRVPFDEMLLGFYDTAKLSAMILGIVVGGALFSQFIAMSGVAADVTAWVLQVPIGTLGTLLLILALYIPLGMFLDPISMALITLPIVFPAIVSLGYDPIWFGVLIVVMAEVALLTPPVGANVYVVKAIAPYVPLEAIFKGAGFFVLLMFLCLAMLIAFPQIALWLPMNIMK